MRSDNSRDFVRATPSKAIDACREVVDGCLAELFRPGMTGERLFDMYVSAGLDPFIAGESSTFDAWEYAEQRAAEMTAPHIDSPPIAP